jgi:hypothetical protein
MQLDFGSQTIGGGSTAVTIKPKFTPNRLLLHKVNFSHKHTSKSLAKNEPDHQTMDIDVDDESRVACVAWSRGNGPRTREWARPDFFLPLSFLSSTAARHHQWTAPCVALPPPRRQRPGLSSRVACAAQLGLTAHRG